MLTKTQLKRIQKAIGNKRGVDIKISKTYLMLQKPHQKQSQHLLLELYQLWDPLELMECLVKDRLEVFLFHRIKSISLSSIKTCSLKHKNPQIVSAIHTGGQVVIKPSVKQRGGFLSTLLASVGVQCSYR